MHAYVLLGAVQRPKDAEIDASQMTSTDADMLVNCSSLLTQEQLQRMKFGIRTDTISWEFYFGELKKTSDETPDAPDEPLDETPDEPAWISVLHDVPNGVKKTADLVCEMVMGMGKEVGIFKTLYGAFDDQPSLQFFSNKVLKTDDSGTCMRHPSNS